MSLVIVVQVVVLLTRKQTTRDTRKQMWHHITGVVMTVMRLGNVINILVLEWVMSTIATPHIDTSTLFEILFEYFKH